jgi:hypothetical protein
MPVATDRQHPARAEVVTGCFAPPCDSAVTTAGPSLDGEGRATARSTPRTWQRLLPLLDGFDLGGERQRSARHTGRMSSQRIRGARRSTRPPAIPDDVADPAVVKASGRVSLPMRVRWSAPARSYDLADRRQRARVYEQVLVEGVEQDVREIIDVDELIALWDELYLPDHVRRAWADWLAERRGSELPC